MNNKICVYAICKNESKFVEKWLDSMQEADYIVVLDTGSTDDTVAKLKADKRVTKVKTKKITPWRFDVARNESMKLVPADANILVCTDLDELFEAGWGDKLRNAWKENTTRAFYTYAWSHSETGEPQDTFKYDKIHTRDYHWIFPVHEVLAPKNKEFFQEALDFGTDIYLHHFPDKTKERHYYFDLLKISVEENPDDCHCRMLLAREYLVNHDPDASLEEYLTTLRMPDIDNPTKKLVLLSSLLQVALIYAEKKMYDEAIWYCHEFIKTDRTYREPYFVLGEIYNNLKLYTLAEATAEAGLEYSTHKYDWVERATTWTWWGYDVLSVAYYGTGKLDKAIEMINLALQHAPTDVRLLKNANAFYQEKINFNNAKLAQIEEN